jgi:uncharacterized protein with GYD domain
VATYILLLVLSSEGREQMLRDPESLARVARDAEMEGVSWLGAYGVLGRYDFVSIISAPSNESAARYSMELGVRAGAHIETLPAVPIGQLEDELRHPSGSHPATAALDA